MLHSFRADTFAALWGQGAPQVVEEDLAIVGGAGHTSISAFVLPTGKKRKKNIEDDITRSMREIYDGIIEQASQKTKKQAAKIVKPFVADEVKAIAVPPASIIDWQAMERDAARVSALLALWQAQMDTLREEEDILLLLMAA